MITQAVVKGFIFFLVAEYAITRLKGRPASQGLLEVAHLLQNINLERDKFVVGTNVIIKKEMWIEYILKRLMGKPCVVNIIHSLKMNYVSKLIFS